MRIRIRDIFDPRSFESGMEIFESGMVKFESGMENFGSGIRYKHTKPQHCPVQTNFYLIFMTKKKVFDQKNHIQAPAEASSST
jgi:hypothetical protein